MTSTEKLLRALVALPSVNPAFVPAGDKRAGEQNTAEFLATVGARAGLDVELQTVLPGRPNLVARLAPRGTPKQRILLAPHLDTVPGVQTQFEPVTKQGRLYGRGACDTKGSVAAMYSAMCELAHGDRRPKETEIIFAGLCDEESAQAGSRALVASGFKADLAIVGEPTKLSVVTAHKGSLWIRFTTRGKSAHGATPQFGKNAVHAMAPVIEAIEGDYREQLAKRAKHPLLGQPTSSLGSICGGSQPNIVPDACSIEVDRRTVPGETEASVMREIKELLQVRKLKAEVELLKCAPCLPMEADTKLPLVQQFMRSAGQTKPLGVHYFCDAAVLAAGGTPSVVFGPGDIAQAHTVDEWIELDQLERARRMLVEFLHSLP
ncbi:MAG: Acetylornithine deacetylase [Verrucomicrobiota bacterium]|jgi:acetylornithine deacetylase/succinyl-diaminopimelate desuccinylase-like protein